MYVLVVPCVAAVGFPACQGKACNGVAMPECGLEGECLAVLTEVQIKAPTCGVRASQICEGT